MSSSALGLKATDRYRYGYNYNYSASASAPCGGQSGAVRGKARQGKAVSTTSGACLVLVLVSSLGMAGTGTGTGTKQCARVRERVQSCASGPLRTTNHELPEYVLYSYHPQPFRAKKGERRKTKKVLRTPSVRRYWGPPALCRFALPF